MTAPESITGYGVWSADDYPIAIEYPLEVLEEIRRQAVDGFNSFGHGGLEIGGVLYGTRQGGTLRIAACAQLECEHARGPGFVLSENDQAAFAKLRKAPAGLESLGWYCSHTRGDLGLAPNDEVLFESYFPQTGRIALVVKPTHWGPAEAIFCFRNGAGEICTPPPRCRFTIEPLKGPSAPEPETAPAAAEQPRRAPAPPAAHPAPHRQRWPWIAAAAMAAALAAVFALRPPAKRLELRAYGVAPGQVRIEWNRRAAPVAGARSGLLEITDGPSLVRLPLSAGELRSTSITYARQTGILLVRLRVEESAPGTPPAEESIRFVGEPVPRPAASPAAPPAPAPAAPVEAPAEVAERQMPEPAPPVESPGQVAERQTPEPAPSAPPVDPLTPTREQPVPETPVSTMDVAPPPEPAVEAPRRTVAFIPPPRPAAVAARPAAMPPPPALALNSAVLPLPLRPPEPAAYTGPRSGRLIWTGSLGRRGVVEIDGSRASVGSLTGALPRGVPLSFRVSPAEFGNSGLVVYTGDVSLNRRREAAGSANGWNATTFEWDPLRARRIAVLEAPNPTNDFNRLVLRNDAPACSVVVIDWRVR